MKDSFENVMEDLKKRDNQDMNRKVDPLRRADDAIELNTDHLSFNQVVTKIIELFNNKVKEIE
jgi:cytidylate kinase